MEEAYPVLASLTRAGYCLYGAIRAECSFMLHVAKQQVGAQAAVIRARYKLKVRLIFIALLIF